MIVIILRAVVVSPIDKPGRRRHAATPDPPKQATCRAHATDARTRPNAPMSHQESVVSSRSWSPDVASDTNKEVTVSRPGQGLVETKHPRITPEALTPLHALAPRFAHNSLQTSLHEPQPLHNIAQLPIASTLIPHANYKSQPPAARVLAPA
ncbi:hypothetical protein CC86DRAFT_100499 [Ophiobolus disseminans]|uniref:Uncharacterized protein n=1 Tax=Ophiobolus disseminans TaxID=1469910 RepID=A0A6A6ZNG3_9PLEO|nr:hypothetical protein CC86DRAFT_100499 [Ophiobolus disseminans]